MRTSAIPDKVTPRHLRTATVLLLGVLLMAVGYFRTSAEVLYAGLLVTAAGVLYAVLQLVIRGKS